jgi:hypothetical protein
MEHRTDKEQCTTTAKLLLRNRWHICRKSSHSRGLAAKRGGATLVAASFVTVGSTASYKIPVGPDMQLAKHSQRKGLPKQDSLTARLDPRGL